MNDSFDILIKHVDDFSKGKDNSPYHYFEPWDRDEGLGQDYVDMAKDDGVDFASRKVIEQFGDVTVPAQFQTGIALSDSTLTMTIAANQCLAEGTLVATPNGPRKIEELVVGDIVYDRYANPTRVTATWDNGEAGVVSLRNRGKEWVVCTPNHKIDAVALDRHSCRWNPSKNTEVNMEASKLEKGYLVRRRYPKCEMGNTVQKNAYVLGAFLGDGCCTCGSKDSALISSADKKIPEKIANILGVSYKKNTKDDGNYSWVFNWKGCELYNKWFRGKLCHEKTIDIDEVKKWDRESCVAFVAGLIDTDGSLGKCERVKAVSLQFHNQSKSAIDAYCYLVLALWQERPSVSEDSRDRYKNGSVYSAALRNPVALRRICEELEPHLVHNYKVDLSGTEGYGKRSRPEALYLTPKPAGRARVYDITVEHPEHFFLLANGLSVSNSGKSFVELIRLGMMISGEFPYAFRYDKGVDTGIPRIVTKENIHRFGRIDISTGKVIDHNPENIEDYKRGDREWNCGNIAGAGKFPEKLIAPDGARIWIGTTRRAYVEMWKPKTDIYNPENCILPRHFVDTTRGNKGYSAINDIIHWVRGITMSFITYESGSVKFEAARVHRCVFDEEPPNREIFSAAMPRSETMAVITTPYRGITWLKEVMDTDTGDYPNYKKIFHCTAFDSPYLNHERVKIDRLSYPPHERAARIWGIPVTQNRATPVFNSLKINIWMQNYKPEYHLGLFVAGNLYDKITPSSTSTLKSLMETPVKLAPASEEDLQYVWRIYETPKPGVAYVLSADVAGGSEDQVDTGIGRASSKDWGAAYIFRHPDRNAGEKWPQPVAQIRSTVLDKEFARTCLLAARHYNNASLAPEAARMSGANASFIAESDDWPYWYMHGSEMWSRRIAQEKKGFDTNKTTRHALYSLLRDWEESYTAEQCPNFYDHDLLDELASAIWNKKGKPDHDVGKKNDLTIAFGIGMYVLIKHPEQFRCNAKEQDYGLTWLERTIAKPKEQAPEFYNFERYR